MDVKIKTACTKAIHLCNYMLQTKDDDFVRSEKNLIELLVINNKNEQAAFRDREVSRYIKQNFDNVVGENVYLDINGLIQESNIRPTGSY